MVFGLGLALVEAGSRLCPLAGITEKTELILLLEQFEAQHGTARGCLGQLRSSLLEGSP